jgi:multiple sugar transport system substrate-binding protein
MASSPPAAQLSRRRFLQMMGAVGAGAALASCGTSSRAILEQTVPPGGFGTGSYDGPPVTLDFWNGFTGGDGPFMRDLVSRFNAEHPNIRVQMNVLQWGDFYPKVPNAVAAASGPDVGIMHIDQLATNAVRRIIVPLDEMIAGLGLSAADFDPGVWDAASFQGEQFGLPLDVHPLGFYANTAQLEQAGIRDLPTDRRGFEDAVAAMQDAGIEQPFWITATWPAHLMFISLLHQFGGSLYDEAGERATFASDAGVEALAWLTSFIDSGASPRNVANDAQAQAFRQQRNSLTWDGIWMMNEWAKVDGLQWAAAPVPQIGERQAVWASSHNFVVTKNAAQDPNRLAASTTFIAWVSERSLEWAKSGQVPARASVREDPAFRELTVQAALADQLPYVVLPPSVPGIGDITGPTFETAVNEVILGQRDAEQALTAAAASADQLLAQNRDKYGA